MFALTIRQPFAWGICAGHKTIEWRTCKTSHRGLVAIHVSRSPLGKGPAADHLISLGGNDAAGDAGMIIGLAEIEDCENLGDPHLWPSLGNYALCGNHNPDPATWPIAWLLKNGRFLPRPIPCRGKLGVWEVPAEIERQFRDVL